jgi:hypothetical protein
VSFVTSPPRHKAHARNAVPRLQDYEAHMRSFGFCAQAKPRLLLKQRTSECHSIGASIAGGICVQLPVSAHSLLADCPAQKSHANCNDAIVVILIVTAQIYVCFAMCSHHGSVACPISMTSHLSASTSTPTWPAGSLRVCLADMLS